MADLFSIRGILLLLICITCGIKTLRRPIIGVSAFMVILILKDVYLRVVFPAAFEFLHLPLVFGILTLISVVFNSRDLINKIGIPIECKLLIAYVTVIQVSYYINLPISSLNESAAESIKFCFLFLLILYSIHNDDDLVFLIKTILLTVFFITCNVYYDYKISGMDISNDIYYFVNRNSLAGTMASTVPIAFSFYFASFNRNILFRIGLVGVVGATILCTILTYSRGGFVALISGLLMVIYLNRRHRLKLTLLLIIVSAVGFYKISDSYWNRIKTVNVYEEDASSMGRVATNIAAINMLKTNPGLGIGAGNFPARVLDFTPPDKLRWVAEGKQIHNIFMQVFSENGFLGGFVYLVLLSLVFFRGYRQQQSLDPLKEWEYLFTGVYISFATYMISAQFGQGAYFGEFYYLSPIIINTYVRKFNNKMEPKTIHANRQDL